MTWMTPPGLFLSLTIQLVLGGTHALGRLEVVPSLLGPGARKENKRCARPAAAVFRTGPPLEHSARRAGGPFLIESSRANRDRASALNFRRHCCGQGGLGRTPAIGPLKK
jgi:hypothetical protein